MRLSLIALLALFVAWSSVAAAQPTPETELKLTAHGGARLMVPASWKETRTDPALVVREQAAEPATQKPFLVALASIEEGPPLAASETSGPRVPWERVRKNIEQAASKNGRTVSLRGDETALAIAGFEARRFYGDLTSPAPAGAPEGTAPRKVAIELVALVKDEKLVTIGIISEAQDKATAAAREQALTIAKTAKLGP